MSTIQSGPARVVETGTVTAFMGFPLRFTWSVDGVSFPLELVFVDDPHSSDVGVSSEYVEGCLTLTCSNFRSATGRGSSRPVLLGESTRFAVFVHFKAFLYGNTDDHTVHYTLYAADKDAIGFKPA